MISGLSLSPPPPNLIQEQKRVREFMKAENKSEKEIKIKQQEMIEELWK